MKTLILTSIFTLLLFSSSYAQSPVNKIDNPQMLRANELRKEILIPNIAGYKAIKGDFHLHTIFSDGSVLPSVRVMEAWRNGLDVIAITDHIEYRPNKDYFKADHNTSYELMKDAAAKRGLILIKGTELTESKPKGGHINALFISDANLMERPSESPDLTQAVDAAIKQGAYLIWNHPGWAVDSCRMYPLNEKWIKEGKIKGVEVFNEKEYYPRAATWCKELNLAPFANTDAHLSYQDLYADGVTPPYTIVLAKEKTMESIKEAMFDGRTIAVFNGQASAKPQFLKAMFESCTQISRLSNGNYVITNVSDIPFSIRSKQLNYNLPPKGSYQFKADKDFEVTISNLHVDENSNLITVIKL